MTTIDESLYSRQLYVLGHDAMSKMSQSDVLIIGLKGLGIEIAKNVVLAGVKSVTIYDKGVVKPEDLAAQFFLHESDYGKRRDEASVGKLAELNSYVPVHVLDGEFSVEMVERFQCVVLTEGSLRELVEINEYTHARGIGFIAADVRGLFGFTFCDFGREFEVIDTNGKDAESGMVAGVSREADGIVTCLEESRHGLEDGDYVTFSEVKGMQELNGCEPRRVKVHGPFTFSIGDTRNLSEYVSGGIFQQVKQPKTISFKSFRESFKEPEFVISDFSKFDRPMMIHLGFIGLKKYEEENKRLPRPRNEEDAKELIRIVENMIKEEGMSVEIEQGIIKEMSFEARGYISAMSGFLGGIVAQEVLKCCSGKFYPIYQYFYFDSIESLPKNYELSEEECSSENDRYSPMINLYGRKFHEKVENVKAFLVGSGAIGCEMLKNWGMMGIGSGKEGLIYITDMDSIEKSNLNRQFLFRPWDVSKSKSMTAAKAVKEMNKDIKIECFQDRVGIETENIFNDEFFERLDVVTNALDNVDARKYVDRRCVYYRKPLLESGTLGTKGNTQVVVPFLTESYSSSQDPPEKSIPMCTLKNFPNQIEHTIQWGRDIFEGLFTNLAENVNQYLSFNDYLENLTKQGKSTVVGLESCLVSEKPINFEQCVIWARNKFEEYFSNNIKQLLFNFPPDSLNSSGTPFWSGPKRCPKPLKFDLNNKDHLDFIIFASNLRAQNFGLKGSLDLNYFKEIVNKIKVEEFIPKSGVKIQVENNENSNENVNLNIDVDSLIKSLPLPNSLPGYKMQRIDFEKDDDSNFHIDFITATSNLRASCYDIPPADKHKTKFIAGKIIPAIATTTALVSGLICLELLKIIDGNRKIDDYKNGFINLSLPLFTFSEPIAAPKLKYNDIEWTLWDRFDINGDITLSQLIDTFKSQHNLSITMVSCNVSMLYSFFMNKKKLEERMNIPISQLVESITKTPIPVHVKDIILEVCVNDANDDDVEVPYVKIRIRP
ncbi:ubiquitin-activating enzyme E1 [Rozella allomycis CSF55]|uniref:Ubiquitin-activating enzyme E1 1 n=1 Tax=Rozella allomycis (strain CSF55) TaxID=988480 RepID=A0A4P9YLJ1_ROZAC|nr:ubiquitin-activating enzyme E1 [Rozella allomycis CSF55]